MSMGGPQAVALSLDRFLFRSSNFALWASAIIASLLLLFCSGFIGIDDFVVTSPLGGGNGGDHQISKQLGIWSALNWSIVYLVLFPCFALRLTTREPDPGFDCEADSNFGCSFFRTGTLQIEIRLTPCSTKS